MKRFSLALLISILAVQASMAQVQSTLPKKNYRVYDLGIQSGNMYGNIPGWTLQDFKALAPQSLLLKNDLSDFSQYEGLSNMDYESFTALIGIQFLDKQIQEYKVNPLLRVGVSYFSGMGNSMAYHKEVRSPFDTLVSAQTGQIVYVDSVNSQHYHMDYSTEQIRLDGSFIYRTNPESRWSVFAGVGLTAGITMNSYTDVYYSSYDRTEGRYENGGTAYMYGYFDGGQAGSEKFSNKTAFVASVYLPLGVDFRFSKRKEFWRQAHLFYEMRPGVNISAIPELGTQLNAGTQHGIGLRIDLEPVGF